MRLGGLLPSGLASVLILTFFYPPTLLQAFEMRLIFPLLQIPLLAITALAQVPSYTGQLLLQPGLNNGKCLTAASNADGAWVTIQPCTGSPSQKWTFTGSTVQIFDNKCLDVTNGVNADGTKMQIWTCSSQSPSQNWYYDKWVNTLVWTNMNKCLDLTGGQQTDGNHIQVWTCYSGSANQVWNTGYMYNQLPQTSQDGQYGINNCGTQSSQSSNCQTAWINSANDFCVFAPPYPSSVGDAERDTVAYCTKSGRGTRVMPDKTLQGVHFVQTQEYVQVTGVGDFTKLNIPAGDEGGELDNRGADGKGNPVGGLVYGNSFGTGLQYHEWTSFISDKEFCFRACVGARSTQLCNHIYDLMGCYWNMPANYDADKYEDCKGDPALPMGVYGTSTWYQGVNPTPTPHPEPSSSNCQAYPTVTVGTPAMRRRSEMVKMRAPEPQPSPPPY